jgi:hypothetical protein
MYEGGSIKFNPLRTSDLFAVGNTMLFSTNNGYNFNPISIPRLKILEFDRTDGSILGFRQGKMYRSTNNGLSWDSAGINFNPNAVEISPDNHNILYAATDTGLLRSTNHGSNWTMYNNTFSYSKRILGVSKDAGSGDTVIVCTDKAVYKVWASYVIIGINNNSSAIPYNFSLSQNYPNPFNPTTKIKFDVPPLKGVRGMSVTLKFYDVLGKEVANLIPPLWGGQEGLKPGTYEVEWDGTNYPSGLYFYKIVTEGFSETKRMVLLK